MSNKQKIEIIITGILIVVLIIISLNTFRAISPKKKDLPKKTEAVVKENVPPPTGRKVDEKKVTTIAQLQKERVQLSWGRDPFAFSKAEDVLRKVPTLTLRGISLGRNGKGFAYINDRILSVGDKIEGYTIIEIKKSKVLIRKGNDSFYLSLPKD